MDEFFDFLEKHYRKFIIAIFGVIAFIIIMVIGFRAIPTVKAGHHGVVTLFGEVKKDILTEGIHIVNPFVAVTEVETRTRKIEVPGEGASKDLQIVGTNVAVNYRLSPSSLSEFYQNIGLEYEDRIMTPTIQESFKAVTAKFTAEELITLRDEVKSQITSNLVDKLMAAAKGGIIVEAVAITNFRFSKAFNDAIESKQVAEQDALRAKRELDRVKIEAEQKIATATAEAASLRVQRQEITPELLELRKIEVQRMAVEKWNGALPTYSGGAIPLLNIK